MRFGSSVGAHTIWAYETCSPSDQFTIQVIEFGGHMDGAIVISHCDAVCPPRRVRANGDPV